MVLFSKTSYLPAHYVTLRVKCSICTRHNTVNPHQNNVPLLYVRVTLCTRECSLLNFRTFASSYVSWPSLIHSHNFVSAKDVHSWKNPHTLELQPHNESKFYCWLFSNACCISSLPRSRRCVLEKLIDDQRLDKDCKLAKTLPTFLVQF